MTTLTATDIELTIDQEFKDLIPPSSSQELADLKAAIESAGRFIDPIRYWEYEGKNLIVDGHQRFSIWCDLPEDTTIPPPRVERMEFPSKEAALNWIEQYQISRRNLTPQKLSLIRGRMYQRRKGAKGGARENPGPKNAQNTGNNSKGHFVLLNSSDNKAAKEVADKLGVNEKTVRRDAIYVESLDAIAKVDAAFSNDIASGQVKLSKQDVQEISDMEKEAIVEAIQNVRAGREWDDDGNAKPRPQNIREQDRSKVMEARSLVTKAVRKIDEVDGYPDQHTKTLAALELTTQSLDEWKESI